MPIILQVGNYRQAYHEFKDSLGYQVPEQHELHSETCLRKPRASWGGGSVLKRLPCKDEGLEGVRSLGMVARAVHCGSGR